ncbi:ABC transporter permease [Jonesiaceae bacterium BS-20]|uniref:ABC transporter permease n=1 Tax=Jonesiaceae bacterium BS-20 TaxID=3120821 RepID=A0AAU7E0Q4_9MICO
MTGRAWRQFKHSFSDVIIEIHTRRSRAVMLMAAVALATGALVAALGISTVAARQVSADMAASTLNTVTVIPATTLGNQQSDPADEGLSETVFPSDTVKRVETLGLVKHVGLFNDLSLATSPILTRPPHWLDNVPGATVAGATSQYVDALGDYLSPEVAWMLDSNLKVAFVGADLAAKLAIPQGTDLTGINVYLDSVPYSVVGIVSSPSERLGSTVLIPYSLGLDLAGSDGQSHLKILTEPGAGNPVAQSVRLALKPEAPEQLNVSQVHTIESLRTGVATQLDKLAGFVGGFLLILTVLLIANAMTVSVMARAGEIGIRGALGASRSFIARLFLFEGLIVGVCGGVAGSAVAAIAITLVSLFSGWSITYPFWLLVLGPLVGIIAGLTSSIYPAYRAASIQPALAVRSD